MIHKFYYLGLCHFKSFILFILLDHAFSIRTSFSRTNTFEIHSISTSKYLIHLITDDIKNYCIFGTIVPLLNVKPNWEKVIYLSFNSFIHPFLACNIHSLFNYQNLFLLKYMYINDLGNIYNSMINLILIQNAHYFWYEFCCPDL